MKSKVFNDPIHGHIILPEICVRIIDTQEFQRLREIRQLGPAFYVFPGAVHTRFEHSIGVCHLAMEWLNKLKQRQPELEISEREIELVGIAGLCHDLGHGPYSHLFDGVFLPMRMNINWNHETGSNMMLDSIFSHPKNQGLCTPEEINMIKNMIMGSVPKEYQKRKFLFQIIANKTNGIDVDKFDYLARDCLFAGIKSSYDFSRLLMFSRVIHGEIHFNAKENYTIYQLFHTRFSLHKQVYSHPVIRAIGWMIVDIFELANEEFHFEQAITDPNEFVFLTDAVLVQIQSSKSPKTAKARLLLKKLREREIYKYVDEILLRKQEGNPKYADQMVTKIKDFFKTELKKSRDAKFGGSSPFSNTTPITNSFVEEEEVLSKNSNQTPFFQSLSLPEAFVDEEIQKKIQSVKAHDFFPNENAEAEMENASVVNSVSFDPQTTTISNAIENDPKMSFREAMAMASEMTESENGMLANMHKFYQFFDPDNDLIIEKVSLNYGAGDKNPVDFVNCYKGDGKESVKIAAESVSLLLPNVFEEISVRLIVKDKDYLHEASKLFQKFKVDNKLPLTSPSGRDYEVEEEKSSPFLYPAKRTLQF